MPDDIGLPCRRTNIQFTGCLPITMHPTNLLHHHPCPRIQ